LKRRLDLAEEATAKFEGRALMPGWVVGRTDGHAAVATRSEAAGNPMFKTPLAPVATLTAEFWVSYRPVRQLRGPSGAVTWSFSQDRVTLSASHHMYGDGTAWAPVAVADEMTDGQPDPRP